jgi:hypothetical protein
VRKKRKKKIQRLKNENKKKICETRSNIETGGQNLKAVAGQEEQ